MSAEQQGCGQERHSCSSTARNNYPDVRTAWERREAAQLFTWCRAHRAVSQRKTKYISIKWLRAVWRWDGGRVEIEPCRKVQRCLMISPLGKQLKANRQTATLRSRWLCPLLHCSFCSPHNGQPRRGGQKNEYLKLQSQAATMWDMKLVLWIIHAR